MKFLDTESPAGRAIELVGDLVKQGRMSKVEARVIEDLVWHPEFPESLRRERQIRNNVTITVNGGYGAAPMVPRRPVTTSPGSMPGVAYNDQLADDAQNHAFKGVRAAEF